MQVSAALQFNVHRFGVAHDWKCRVAFHTPTRHTQHVTRHTSSHVTHHTSHFTRTSSHVTHRSYRVTRHHTSHITRHISHEPHHTSHIDPTASHVCSCQVLMAALQRHEGQHYRLRVWCQSLGIWVSVVLCDCHTSHVTLHAGLQTLLLEDNRIGVKGCAAGACDV